MKSTFSKLSSHSIPMLGAELEQYVDTRTGARHVHLATDQAELAFLVGFPTVPDVSDGRAHILEHLALCGSERYPVADPFFSMLRRSTATFMNAMTYADRTVYPFASTDRQDFFNLLDVYLDSVFFPKLDYLSFRQEGWRHTLQDGRLAYQGVVFNEMKGAFGDPMRALHHGITKHLFAGTTYAVESGGDPLHIPELTHEMLLAFHASHYHPSQAMFMTSGRISAAEVQERIGERVLARFEGGTAPRVPTLAPRWSAPREVDVLVPSQAGRADEFGVQLAWHLGESTDAMEAGRLQMVSRGLLGSASAPVMKAMQSAGFGRPSRLNGVDGSCRELIFHLGMEGLTEPQVEQASARIEAALQRAAQDGVPADVFAAELRDMRFRQREVRGGGTPDGLGRLLNAVPALMYGGDVLRAFDNEEIVNKLEDEFADPARFNQLVGELIDSKDRLKARVVPDAHYALRRSETEALALQREAAAMDDPQRQRIKQEEADVAAHRHAGKGSDLLPRIASKDVGRAPRQVPAVDTTVPGLSFIDVPSNGISYATVVYDLSALPKEDWPWLALYAAVVQDVGVKDMDFEQASAWRRALVPSFGVQFDALLEAGRADVTPRLAFFAGGLQEKHADIVDVLQAWTMQPRFDEIERIAFLCKSRSERVLGNLAEASGGFAAHEAAAAFSPKRRFDREVQGLPTLAFAADLKRRVEQGAAARIAETLDGLRERIQRCPRRIVWAASSKQLVEASALLCKGDGGASVPVATRGHQADHAAMALANAGFVVSSQVNHCYAAWGVPGIGHEDAGPLAVAAELLGSQILHRRIREEGGAYGGSASYSFDDGTFVLSSYRDPRLAQTYADFEASLDELIETPFNEEQIDEAIIGVIKRLDKPLSPYAQADEADRLARRGLTVETRQDFRASVLACRREQIVAVVRRWLKGTSPSRAASVGHLEKDLAGLQSVELLSLAN